MESLKTMAAGGLMAILAFPVMWCNEGRSVRTYEMLKEGAGAVVEVDASKVASENESKLVHISGKPKPVDAVSDPVFAVTTPGVGLKRVVEVFQWHEHKTSRTVKDSKGKKRTETEYTYKKEWGTNPVDSSTFHKTEGHENLGATLPYENQAFPAATVTVGAFKLSKSLQDRLSGWKSVDMTDKHLAALTPEVRGDPPKPKAVAKGKRKRKRGKRNMAHAVENAGRQVAADVKATANMVKGAFAQAFLGKKRGKTAGGAPAAGPPLTLVVHGGAFYRGKNPNQPAIGDVRIRFEEQMSGDVSIVAQQKGDHLAPYATESGEPIEMLVGGVKPAQVMFADSQAANVTLTWLLRFAGFMLLFLGLRFVLNPFAEGLGAIPLVGSFLGGIAGFGLTLVALIVAAPIALLTIAIAWIFARPILGIGLLVAGAALIVGPKLLAKKGATQEQAQAPAG